MFFSLVPVEIGEVLATEGEPEEGEANESLIVESLKINKNFNRDRNIESMNLLIEGENLSNAKVQIHYGGQLPLVLYNQQRDPDISYFNFIADIKKGDFEKLVNISKIDVISGRKKITIPLSGDYNATLPEINSVTRKVNIDTEESLVIRGSNFNLFSEDTSNTEKPIVQIKYGKDINFTPISIIKEGENATLKKDKQGNYYVDYKISSEDDSFLGMNNLEVVKSFKIPNSSETEETQVKISYNYKDQFRMVKNLRVPDDLEMYPTKGKWGTTVYFESTSGDRLNQYDDFDVFFVKQYTEDAFQKENKGIDMEKDELGRYVSVKVPNIPVDDYYVILTNKIIGDDPTKEVTQEKVMKIKYKDGEDKEEDFVKFKVTEKDVLSSILDIEPKTGPDAGSSVTIKGTYLGSLNIDDLTIEDGTVLTPIVGKSGSNTLKVQYETIKVQYETKNVKYKEASVKSIEKYIQVMIGKEATFEDGSEFSPGMDILKVKTPQVTVEGDPRVDVIVTTETVIKTEGDREYRLRDIAIMPKGFTFIPSTLKPQVSQILPPQIFVTHENKISEDVQISVTGRDFLVTKVQGITRYPKIEFRDTANNILPLDPNEDTSIDIKVLNNNGEYVDGSPGNEVGTKILLTFPKESSYMIPITFLDTKIPVFVINPKRNSDAEGLGSDENVNAVVEFRKISEDSVPTIRTVTPDIVAVEGNEIVTIEGSNFRSGARLFLDGQEIRNFTRSGEGTRIIFNAPRGREGKTQLQVLNPDGGMAIWEFEYVKTYTNPKITSFSPNRGNTGTVVVLKGENFLAPDPTATEHDIPRLLGTRVLLGGKDINLYNTKDSKIVLKEYKPKKGDEILKVGEDSRQIELADYWYSVIFQATDGKFFTLRPDAKGTPVLSDGVNRNYEIKAEDGKIYAYPKTGAGKYEVLVCDGTEPDQCNGIVLVDGEEKVHLSLSMLSPYNPDDPRMDNSDKIGGPKIQGSRVKVLDSNTLIFYVPIIETGRGWYDVTVLNPDTKRDSRTGEQGFYYYTQPQSTPEITEVIPDKGSTDGGYTIDILGRDFKDDGTDKVRVYINGVEVNSQDVFVGVNGTTITAKVPPYQGDLSKEKETDRITVPVVVVNPDGGSASKEDGFTYMVPTSHPKINRIIPAKGSAAGKEIVEIWGMDFRYFEPFSDDNRNGKWDEGENYRDINGNGQWDDFRLDAVKKKLGKKYNDNKDLIQNLKENIEDYAKGNDKTNASFEKIVVPVLPKVYFGNKTAEIVEFSDGYLKVITPAGEAGAVDVYIVNNDAGVSNKVRYNYESTNPFISNIVPNEGNKKGKDRIEIFGGGFVESDIKVVTPEDTINPITQSLVRFGNISNHDIPRDRPNSGRIDNKRTTVELPGGLKISYDGNTANLNTVITEGGKTYAKTFKYKEDDGVVYFPTELLRGENNTPYPGNELIRFEIKDRRLLVERGYSPKVEFLNNGQLVVTTPTYYTIGPVDVIIINPDGGKASGKFIYKHPDSNPSIINVTKEGEDPREENINGKDVRVIKISYKGGHNISVIGNDFRENAKISIGDVATINPNQITYLLPSKLTFKMPQVPETAVGKLHRVVVTNEDGASAASDDPHLKPPIYIMFIKGETGPVIEKLTPDKGTATGGNTVKIEGKDFREGLKVYWGGQTLPEDKVRVIDYKTIHVKVPPHGPGRVEVKVENPDGELSNSVYYTYLSSPKISEVIDPEDSTETQLITRVSAEGGQTIKIKGYGFMPGARVLFNPSIKRVEDEDTSSGTIIYIDGEPYRLEYGVDGRDTKVIDAETITVVTPPGKVGTGGIIVLNPDKGASDIYENIKYVLPELSAPMNVVAELVYDRYIKIHWSPVEKAEGYEIYAVIDDHEIDFVGSTDLTSFVFSDLESNTRYKFIVKALGRFGSSPPSAESNSVKTGRRVGPPDDDGAIDEETTKRVEGDRAIISIGTEDYKDDQTIDLTELAIHGVKKVVISIPAEVVARSNSGDITIRGKDFTLKFNPSVFDTNKVREYRHRSDAGVRFEIAPYTGATNLKGNTALSMQYSLTANFFLEKDITPIENLVSVMSLVMEYDNAKANLRNLRNIKLVRYQGYTDTWESVIQDNLGTSIRAYIDKMGRYLIIGGRR